MRNGLRASALAIAVMLPLSACGASAQEQETLEGKTISLIIPFDAGGGYDNYARQLAPELAAQLNAKVVVINKPGAGGLLATNEVWNAKPDGTTIVMFNTVGHLGSALAGADGVQYDPEKFGYIGRISSEPDVIVTGNASPHKDFDSFLSATEPVRFAATGPGSNEYVTPVVLEEIFGMKNEVVTGFASSNEAYLSVLAGDVDAHSRSLGSQLPGIAAGDAEPILVLGSQPVDELKGIPTLMDVVPEGETRPIAEAHAALMESGRTLAAPPETDPAILEQLRTAFEEVVTDETYIAAADKAGRPVSFASGTAVESTISTIMDSPTSYVDALKRAYGTN